MPPTQFPMPHFGQQILAHADELAQWSDDADALTCAYLGDAHRRTAARLAQSMAQAGMQVTLDAVGNVVGRYASDNPQAKTLLTGSHYDTVRDAGKYDGRAGILLAIAVVAHLHVRGERLPFHLEVIGFSDEEGLRFGSTFLGSSAVAGRFDPDWLRLVDAQGVSLGAALREAGHDPAAIAAIARDPATLLGYVEVHIEQGPVLLTRALAVGVVSAIAGSCRYTVALQGCAGHAGTTPMSMRRDAAAAAAEIVLYVEQRCGGVAGLVGTVGQLQVPGGSINVIPGRCEFSLDIRAGDDAVRDAAVADILDRLDAVCARRGIVPETTLRLKAAAVPCAPWLMQQLAAAVERRGTSALLLPSGAGHDAMMLARVTEVGMLFIRCGNGGISHNPLETMTAEDADLAARIFLDFLRSFSAACPCLS